MHPYKAALREISGGRVLDIASGKGEFIRFLQEHLRDYQEIIGIDMYEGDMADLERSFDSEKVHFCRMDATKMEFADERFDTVTISNSLHHFVSITPILNEAKRVLKPDGHFIISEMYNDNQTAAQLTHVRLHHWRTEIDTLLGKTHHKTFQRQELINIIQEIGLRSVVFYDYCELDTDPQAPEAIQEFNHVIERGLQQLKEIPGSERLQRQGVDLRQQTAEVGFHPATVLIGIGKK